MMLRAIVILGALCATAHADELRVEFRGNHDVSSDDLRAAIHAGSPDPIVAMDSPVFERDLLLVSAYYWDHGYANVKVQTPVLDAAHATITVPLVEGARFTIGPVTFGGELSAHAPDALANVHVRPGVVFSRTMIAEDRARLAESYRDQGFAFANVVPLTHLELATKTISIEFELTRGKRAKIERIEFVGNTKIASAILARDFAYGPGELYDPYRLDAGKDLLLASGHARDVAISEKRGSTDALVVVTVAITE
jgi:outer membrane protein insertion porin family